MSNYAYLLLAIVAEVIATSALKASDGFSKVGIGLIVAGVVVINAFSTASVH